MKKHAACGLCSINLSEYIIDPYTENAYVDYENLKKDIYSIVKAMDDIIDENLPNHALVEQKEVAQKYRNIGIGVMGFHDLLIKLGIVYGSPESISWSNELSTFLFRNAVYASVELAKERGNFEGYSSKIWDSDIIKTNFSREEIIKLKQQDALRNCSLLSIAPTGSIGTMLNVSTGIEPWFSTHYKRKTVSLEGQETYFDVYAPVIQEAMDHAWKPNTYVTANEISYISHVDIQAAWQNAVDTAISKTINMSADTTDEDIHQLYKYAWEKGCKGMTIYVDGSRVPILSTESASKPKESTSSIFNSIVPISRKQMGVTQGCTFCKKCACGTLYITANKDKDGNLVEIFTHTSKGGICQANLNAETRMASLALRAGVKVDEVVDQLKGISCPACTAVKARGGNLDGISCPDIIARTINEFKEYNSCIPVSEKKETQNVEIVSAIEYEECPECHEKTLIREAGCKSCTNCGYSKCN